jgi:hypothetical protein
METLEFIKRAEGGKIIIEVPEDLEGKELRIKVTEKEPEDEELKKFRDMKPEERLRHLEQFRGKAKYPYFPITKYDVYDQ